jgi:hypothetical protein
MGSSLPPNVVSKTTDTGFQYHELEEPSGDPPRLDDAPMSLPSSAIPLPSRTMLELDESCGCKGPIINVAYFMARRGDGLTAHVGTFKSGYDWYIVEFTEEGGPYDLPYLLPKDAVREVLEVFLDSRYWRLTRANEDIRDAVIDTIVE